MIWTYPSSHFFLLSQIFSTAIQSKGNRKLLLPTWYANLYTLFPIARERQPWNISHHKILQVYWLPIYKSRNSWYNCLTIYIDANRYFINTSDDLAPLYFTQLAVLPVRPTFYSWMELFLVYEGQVLIRSDVNLIIPYFDVKKGRGTNAKGNLIYYAQIWQ